MKNDYGTWSDEDEFKIKTGFHIGAGFEIPITNFLWIEPGMLISTRGMRMVEEGYDGGEAWKDTETANQYYLDIPVNVMLGYDFGSVKVYGILGPYFGIGLAGKYKWKEEWDGQSDSGSEDIEWGDNPDLDDVKRPDFGLRWGAGAQFKGFELSLIYALGLSNISAYQEYNNTWKHRVFGITFGYKFDFSKE